MVEYIEGTTDYDRNGVELLADLKRAHCRRVEMRLVNNIPTLVVGSLDGGYQVGVQSEGGRYVVVSVDDSVRRFTSIVSMVRASEGAHQVQNSLVRPVTSADLDELVEAGYRGLV